MALKDLLTFVAISLQAYLRDNKKMKKQYILDDWNVKIFESQGKFDILTKDSVWNIEKVASKK